MVFFSLSWLFAELRQKLDHKPEGILLATKDSVFTRSQGFNKNLEQRSYEEGNLGPEKAPTSVSAPSVSNT